MTQQIEISDSDIAIVGMSGRFPGAADIAELWRLICDGESGITRFTEQELLAAGISPELLADPSYVRAGAVIEGIDEFDAGFFGVGPKEAQILDPQQRLYLEHNWQALEDAGCDPTRFAGAIGVFGGSAWSSYLQNNLMPGGTGAAMGELVVGLANDKDSLTTRVAHTLGLTGPAYSVQSYCSTSLVAVCAAATSLANFECDLALAGGVNVHVPHRVGYLYSQGGIAPPDGECRAFDAAGLGAPVGSGVGVVALRRLSDALADGDRVYAVIRGWAVNNDGGRKVGFTAPGVQGQAAVIAEALSSADLTAADIDYIEAHGTGTALGDASELAALQQVFRGESCLIGSVKTNLGHLDRAAGVTGLIKATLAVRSGQLPPSRNLVDPNPQLHTGEADLEVVTSLRDWPAVIDDQPRRAGVSAFGIGGTNAHVVLEQAPSVDRPQPIARPELLIWSGRDAVGAQARTEALAEHLAGTEDRLCDVAYTLQTGRRVFEHRRLLVAGSSDEALTALREGTVLSGVEARTDRPVGFLIAGTGEQYPGMAAELYRDEPVFREVLDECRSVLMSHLGGLDPLADLLAPRNPAAFSLGQLLGREELPAAGAPTSVDATEKIQPAVFAVQYALAQLLRSWGIQPTVLAGYSVGEYVAACLAGVLTLDAALALVAKRAQLIGRLPAGAMAAVSRPVGEVEWALERSRIDGLDIAAVNGREVTVVSGEPAALAQFRVFLEAENAVCRPLATSHAFHSRMLEPIQAELTEWISQHITLSAPVIPYLSNVSGAFATAEQVTDPAYWAEHMCAPVQFESMLATLLADQELALLELGPGQSLGALTRAHADCAQHRWRQIVPSLPAAADPRPAGLVLAEAVGRLWLAGVEVDWQAYQADRPVGKVGLPGYPFQRAKYWIDAPVVNVPAPRPEAAKPHVELLAAAWREAPSISTAPIGNCLLVGGGELADALAAELERQGAEVGRQDAGPISAGYQTVVDLRAVTAQPTDDGQAAVLELAALADACGNQSGDSTLLLVTRGGQAIGTGRPVPGQAAVAALAAVVNQEYLNVACRILDLDPAADRAADLAALRAELAGTEPELFTGYRDGRRLLREFGPVGAAGKPVRLRPGGSYLITGGLGEVGLRLAEHLARAGVGRLVLASRSGLPEDPAHPRVRAVERLRELAEVQTPAVDVTDPIGMRALLADGRWDGVIHAAAEVGRDSFRPLRDAESDAVTAHFAAKVGGGRVLQGLIEELPLEQRPDFCVLFSSTSAVLGGLAFGSYAAANAALAALGQQVDGAAGTRWLSAGWDTWASTLQVSADGVGESMLAHSMTAEQALAAFDAVLTTGQPSVLVVAAGLADRLPTLQVAAPVVAISTGQRFGRPELPQPYSPPLTPTERALAELWAGVLGVEPVGTRDNFFDLSGNSLLALQMLKLVKDQFGIAVASVTLFESPTVHALANVLDEAGGVAKPAAAVAAPALVRAQPDERDIDRRIAVVGMAGRFPGAADVASFWRNITGGVESISFFSPDELIAAGVDPATVADPAYVPARPVLDDVSGFDAAFFGISPRMAAITDPQQRLFLEVCWEALEQAGYAAPEYRGRVGVYGGSNISTYLLQMPEQAITGGDVSTYEIIMGNDKDALTTTVSYLFDLAGPSVAVQTFCSTSLVATHLAVQSLRNGECELALAGGVSIRVPNKVGHLFGPGGQESPDGHVRTFDAKAKGSMFGDGAAVVALKRLSDALRDGDHIWSVIRGSAMNNDGALKVGYTAPSVVGQSRVVSDAMADAGVTGDDIGYIEAHGTATELGDPIEVAALTRAFGHTTTKQYCPIGSVKTNVGHLDRAAGVTGLIKTSLALTEELLPATLHYTAPNPQIDFADSPFYVNSELSPWPVRDGRPKIAGINSLGMGGTNVHVVVEQAPGLVRVEPGDDARRYQVLPVSARNPVAADQACQRLADHLAATPESRLLDVAYTLQVGRKDFEHRRVLVAGGRDEAVAGLAGKGLLSRVETARGRQTAFLFTGVGEQYPGMVAELYRREPVFRAELDECLAILADQLPDIDALDLLAGERSAGAGLAALLGRTEAATDPRAALLEQTETAQPLLFAVEYALARTLIGWGVQPRVMFGYSLGEYVAACLAGVFTLPDALKLVAHRARLIGTVEAGGMVAVSLPPAELQRRFRLAERELDIAAVNGPQVTVVAGPVDAVAGLVAALRTAEVPCRQLQTSHAFHSRMLAGIGAELTEWIAGTITLNPPTMRYLSNVTGGIADAGLVCDPGYWARHMCATVQFAEAASSLLADPELAVVEIGPGQSLGAMIRAAGAEPRQWPLILSTLPAASDRRPDDAVLADCIARSWLLGVELDWLSYHGRRDQTGDHLPGRVPLPTYPFQRQRYWIEGAPRGSQKAAAVAVDESGEITFDTIAALPKLPEEQWLHLPVWRQSAGPAASTERPSSWLVYTRDGLADAVVAELRGWAAETGASVTLIRPGDCYAAAEDGFTLRPGSVSDTLAMLRAHRATGRTLERVLHLWTLAASPAEVVVPEGLHTLVALARAAGELGMDDWALDVVVAGTQQVLDDDVSAPHAATVTGPCRVIPLEYPSVRTRLIDLDPDPGLSVPRGLLAELGREHTEPLVALRHGRRWLPGYETMQPPAAEPTVLRPGGVYLVTGGLGGIGLAMADRLARDCQAKLVLLGRHGLPPEADWAGLLAGDCDDRTRRQLTTIGGWKPAGAEYEVVVGDVSNPDDVRRAVELAISRFGALHGVLHVAGVPAMGLMQFKQPAELDQVLAPKLAGALAITDALRIGKPDELELDFLVLFSSITSATGGGPGQVDYCAANAFLDSYACQLASTGRRVLSVDWGEWTWNAWEEGLGGYADVLQSFFRENRARIGIDFDEGWRSLLRVLACPEPRLVVSTQDFPTMIRYSSKFTVAAVTSPALSDGGAGRHPRPELVTAYQEPTGEVELAIAEIWCEALRLERLGVADNFFELGGNSLLGVNIVAELRKRFDQVELAPHVLYEAPTVAALAALVNGAESGPIEPAGDEDNHVRAQLRRSGLQASADRRRTR